MCWAAQKKNGADQPRRKFSMAFCWMVFFLPTQTGGSQQVQLWKKRSQVPQRNLREAVFL